MKTKRVLSMFLCAVMIATVLAVAVPVNSEAGIIEPPPGMVSWWPMDGSVEDIVDGNDPSDWDRINFVPGMVDEGVTFESIDRLDPGGYIDIPQSENLELQEFTIDAWVRPDGPGPTGPVHGSSIIIKNFPQPTGGVTVSVALLWYVEDSRFRFIFGHRDYEVVFSDNDCVPGYWYHVAASYDGDTFKLYVNGDLEGTQELQKTIDYDSSFPFVIGAMADYYRIRGYPRTWNGVIDEVEIFNRALSVSEIQTIYSAGSDGKRKSPNEPPEVTITGPEAGSIYPIGTPVTFTGTFTDVNTGDTHTAEWKFESKLAVITSPGTVTESDGSGTVTGAYAFADPGVYMVTLTVTDDDDGVGTANTIGDLTAMVVIYDPSAGFVTGGGWFESPPGALLSDSMVTGKAGFGFFAKYKKGADVPTGNTEFRFHAGDIEFHSTSYDWLVIAGPKAMFKGTGELNGEAGYGFLISAIDGEQPGGGGVDRIRVKIWDNTGEIIYDNNVGNGGVGAGDDADPVTMVVHGEIKIHR
ncbi:MAG: LamG-like jellyroll fold domain-containing protein [Thermoplasmata archaeon]